MSNEFKKIVNDLSYTYAPFGYTWLQWGTIAKFISHVDYGCRFADKGCQRMSSPVGCCCSCAEQKAWFFVAYQGDERRYIGERVNPEAIPLMISLWDKEKGFCGKKGCRLPFAYRSSMCLKFFCDRCLKNDVHRECIEELHSILSGIGFVKGRLHCRRIPLVLREIKKKLQEEGLWKTNSPNQDMKH